MQIECAVPAGEGIVSVVSPTNPTNLVVSPAMGGQMELGTLAHIMRQMRTLASFMVNRIQMIKGSLPMISAVYANNAVQSFSVQYVIIIYITTLLITPI